MTILIADELRQHFELASMRREARTLHSPSQWNRVSNLVARCDKARHTEVRDFESRYHTRVEIARRRLIDEAGKMRFDLKPRFAGDDRFSPDALLRQAQREVRARHAARLSRIDQIERRELTMLTLGAVRSPDRDRTLSQEFGRVVAFPGPENRNRNRPRDR